MLLRTLAALAALAFLLPSCSKKSGSPTGLAPARTYCMGFSAIPPKPDLGVALAALDLWTRRADAGVIVNEPPWDSLLAGRSPDSLIRADQLGLANYFRARGLRVVVSIDATNGLDRAGESAPLVVAGRSLTEPAIRQLYRAYVTAMDTLLHPDYLSVASETNLIRLAAPPALYAAVVQVANDAAADVRARAAAVRLLTTVQVEVAWGRQSPPGSFVGVDQDRVDFPFIEALGLSSYPYLGGFNEPEQLPLDYYSRLAETAPIPEMVIEGRWTSASVGGITSSPEKQRRYLLRQAQILDRAGALYWFQITFTDLDLTAIPLPPGSILPLFAALGLVDVNLAPKPALAAWDAAFARQHR